MKKIRLSIVAFLAVSFALTGQTLQEAIKLTNNEQFSKAEESYKILLQGQPTNGEILFYYGENFYKDDRPEKAKEQYAKAVELNATSPFGYVGLGKMEWNDGKQTEAKANFYKATTLAAGKNATVLMKIAEVYIQSETKNIAEALTLLGQASKLEPKNPEVFILTGDAYLEQNNGNNAITNYEKAEALDKKSVRAILRQGQLYNRAKNYNLALDLYKKASLIDSSYAPAYREKAEIYARAGMYANAVYNYKRFLAINNDCGARVRYAAFLYQAKQYKESIAASKEAQTCDPKNVYLNRFLAYAEYEAADYENGLMNSELFFKNVSGSDIKVIPLDYEYYAKLLSKNKKDSLAIIQYRKALELQPDKIELNSDIATAYRNMKQYEEAIKSYKIRIDAGKGSANDYYGLGISYYYSKDFINADSSFVQFIKLQPDMSLGYLWRGKANAQIDSKNEKWLAKPYYETFLGKAKADENKNNQIEANTYMGVYYMNNKDFCSAKTYFKKIAELDPNNANAKNFLNSAEAKKCP